MKLVHKSTIQEFGNIHTDNFHNMVYVEGGSFLLGDEEEYFNPKHSVSLDSFYISKYLVTQDFWNTVMGYNHSSYKKKLPVTNISWYEAVEFCNELTRMEELTSCYKIDRNSKDPNNHDDFDTLKWTVECNFKANGYRLPTEAEWEYAARGGKKSRGYKYAGSNCVNEVAWYRDNSEGKIQNVGEKKCNELGIYDMSGNVFEWCWNWSDSSVKRYYERNPTGPLSGKSRVRRGGGFRSSDETLSVAHTSVMIATNHGMSDGGFRVVRTTD